MHVTIRVLLYVLKGFCSPWIFPEDILYQAFVGHKSNFLKKMSLNFGPWNFLHLRNYQGQRGIHTVHIYNFDRKFNRKKLIISIFSGTKRREQEAC